MLRLLAEGQALSVHAAARTVAESAAASNHSRVADVTRLRRKFVKAYGADPPEGKTWRDIEHQPNTN